MNTPRLFLSIFTLLLALSAPQAWSYSNSTPTPESEAIAHTGTVLETMDSRGYTYIRVEEKDTKFWIALPQTEVKVGEKISFYEQMLMENFTSQSLNRTFDRILFVGAINKGTELPTQAKAKTSPHKKPPSQHAEPQQTQALGTPVGRFTIKEVFEQKNDLSGKTIELKGKISKISPLIMERNWVHIEDGSGTETAKNNKIILRTTQAGVAVGDEVVAKGVLYVNKDFGYGYFYPVIVEDAEFSK